MCVVETSQVDTLKESMKGSGFMNTVAGLETSLQIRAAENAGLGPTPEVFLTAFIV